MTQQISVEVLAGGDESADRHGSRGQALPASDENAGHGLRPPQVTIRRAVFVEFAREVHAQAGFQMQDAAETILEQLVAELSLPPYDDRRTVEQARLEILQKFRNVHLRIAAGKFLSD